MGTRLRLKQTRLGTKTQFLFASSWNANLVYDPTVESLGCEPAGANTPRTTAFHVHTTTLNKNTLFLKCSDTQAKTYLFVQCRVFYHKHVARRCDVRFLYNRCWICVCFVLSSASKRIPRVVTHFLDATPHILARFGHFTLSVSYPTSPNVATPSIPRLSKAPPTVDAHSSGRPRLRRMQHNPRNTLENVPRKGECRE